MSITREPLKLIIIPDCGWVIISWTDSHPSFRGGMGWVLSYTFRHDRASCIREFTSCFDGKTWRQLRKKGYRCVRASVSCNQEKP